MGRFLLALSFLLVFVAATGFCQSGSFSSEQKLEIREIVRDAIRDELQNFNRQQPVPVSISPTYTTNISTDARPIDSRRNELTELGQSRKSDIIELIALKNRGASRRYIEDVVKTYFIEAEAEHINHDIAIAQMLYATDYLKNVKRTAVHNYSGMLNASFCDRTIGIRAHIQHLRFYAEGSLVNNDRNVDPRYSVLRANRYLGTVSTFDDLCRKWAPQSRDYGDRIRAILNEMNCFAYWR